MDNHETPVLDAFLRHSREKAKANEQQLLSQVALSFDGLRPATADIDEKELVPPYHGGLPALKLLSLALQNSEPGLWEDLPTEVLELVNEFKKLTVDEETGEPIVSRKKLFLLIEALEKLQQQGKLPDYLMLSALDKVKEKFASIKPMIADRFYINGRAVPIQDGVGIFTGADDWRHDSESDFYQVDDKSVESVLYVPAVENVRLARNIADLARAALNFNQAYELQEHIIESKQIRFFDGVLPEHQNESWTTQVEYYLFKPLRAEITTINWLAEDERTYPVAVLTFPLYLKKAAELIEKEVQNCRELLKTPGAEEQFRAQTLKYLKAFIRYPEITGQPNINLKPNRTAPLVEEQHKPKISQRMVRLAKKLLSYVPGKSKQ